ncbi:MAG: hypothetical protein Ta2D_14060 [Rickettsiales bacterium]|nr:MAG: hypothetical protein Ta2D_14060 [Rickettsiales bacterium]
MTDYNYKNFQNSKIACCNVGIKINGTEYFFDDVDTMTFEDPMTKTLKRGLGSQSKIGVSVVSNRDQPVKFSISTGCISVELFNLLKDNFSTENEERFEFFYYDKDKDRMFRKKYCQIGGNPTQTDYGDNYQMTKLDINTLDR